MWWKEKKSNQDWDQVRKHHGHLGVESCLSRRFRTNLSWNQKVFHDNSILASESPFESYKSKRILFFAYLICPLVFGLFNFSKKLNNILEIVLNRMELSQKKSLWDIWNKKIANKATVQGERNKFPLTSSFQTRTFSGRKNSTIHFISKFLVYHDSQLYKL